MRVCVMFACGIKYILNSAAVLKDFNKLVMG